MFTTKSKGQGFGLPVVKRMTESLGGTVTFESEEGKGTTFSCVSLLAENLTGNLNQLSYCFHFDQRIEHMAL
jgi:nitrogen-specific signal transduction histidine kinase